MSNNTLKGATMKFNQKTIHAITLCTKLNQQDLISLNQLSIEMGVSKVYLEQVARPLKNANIITATLGPKGGYQLLTHPNNISILKIVQLFESTLFEKTQLENTIEHQSIMKTMTTPFDSHILKFFESITLQDFINNKQSDSLMFYI